MSSRYAILAMLQNVDKPRVTPAAKIPVVAGLSVQARAVLEQAAFANAPADSKAVVAGRWHVVASRNGKEELVAVADLTEAELKVMAGVGVTLAAAKVDRPGRVERNIFAGLDMKAVKQISWVIDEATDTFMDENGEVGGYYESMDSVDHAPDDEEFLDVRPADDAAKKLFVEKNGDAELLALAEKGGASLDEAVKKTLEEYIIIGKGPEEADRLSAMKNLDLMAGRAARGELDPTVLAVAQRQATKILGSVAAKVVARATEKANRIPVKAKIQKGGVTYYDSISEAQKEATKLTLADKKKRFITFGAEPLTDGPFDPENPGVTIHTEEPARHLHTTVTYSDAWGEPKVVVDSPTIGNKASLKAGPQEDHAPNSTQCDKCGGVDEAKVGATGNEKHVGPIFRLAMDKSGEGASNLCEACWNEDMKWRKERNENLEGEAKFPILPFPTRKDLAAGKLAAGQTFSVWNDDGTYHPFKNRDEAMRFHKKKVEEEPEEHWQFGIRRDGVNFIENEAPAIEDAATEEVRLWLLHDEGLYHQTRRARDANQLKEMVLPLMEGAKWINVDLKEVDWDEVYEDVCVSASLKASADKVGGEAHTSSKEGDPYDDLEDAKRAAVVMDVEAPGKGARKGKVYRATSVSLKDISKAAGKWKLALWCNDEADAKAQAELMERRRRDKGPIPSHWPVPPSEVDGEGLEKGKAENGSETLAVKEIAGNHSPHALEEKDLEKVPGTDEQIRLLAAGKFKAGSPNVGDWMVTSRAFSESYGPYDDETEAEAAMARLVAKSVETGSSQEEAEEDYEVVQVTKENKTEFNASKASLRRSPVLAGIHIKGEESITDPMVRQYLATALWSTNDNSNEAGGNPLDSNYGIEDLPAEEIQKAVKDCEAFKEKAGALIDGVDPEQVGHDFWLTRNGHGAGFWDRPEMYGGKDNANKLTEISKTFGTEDIYVGDDKKLYFGAAKVLAVAVKLDQTLEVRDPNTGEYKYYANVSNVSPGWIQLVDLEDESEPNHSPRWKVLPGDLQEDLDSGYIRVKPGKGVKAGKVVAEPAAENRATPGYQEGKFEVGKKIKITEGDYAGYCGKVLKVSQPGDSALKNDKRTLYVELIKGKWNTTRWVEPNQLEAVSEEEYKAETSKEAVEKKEPATEKEAKIFAVWYVKGDEAAIQEAVKEGKFFVSMGSEDENEDIDDQYEGSFSNGKGVKMTVKKSDNDLTQVRLEDDIVVGVDPSKLWFSPSLKDEHGFDTFDTSGKPKVDGEAEDWGVVSKGKPKPAGGGKGKKDETEKSSKKVEAGQGPDTTAVQVDDVVTSSRGFIGVVSKIYPNVDAIPSQEAEGLKEYYGSDEVSWAKQSKEPIAKFSSEIDGENYDLVSELSRYGKVCPTCRAKSVGGDDCPTCGQDGIVGDDGQKMSAAKVSKIRADYANDYAEQICNGGATPEEIKSDIVEFKQKKARMVLPDSPEGGMLTHKIRLAEAALKDPKAGEWDLIRMTENL